MSPIKYLIVNTTNESDDYVNEIAEKYRANSIPVDIYRENNGLKSAMKYANKIGVENVIIVKNNTCVVKNMLTGVQSSIDGNPI
jgi:histidyl-tRNA synthetase